MCSFRYVSDISGYTEVLYHPKNVLLIFLRLVSIAKHSSRVGLLKCVRTHVIVLGIRVTHAKLWNLELAA